MGVTTFALNVLSMLVLAAGGVKWKVNPIAKKSTPYALDPNGYTLCPRPPTFTPHALDPKIYTLQPIILNP